MMDNAEIHFILHAGQDIVLCGDLINIMSGESPEPAHKTRKLKVEITTRDASSQVTMMRHLLCNDGNRFQAGNDR